MSNQEKVETLYKNHPDLSWDSYEQNAVDQGYELDSEQYYQSVLNQAHNDLDSKSRPRLSFGRR